MACGIDCPKALVFLHVSISLYGFMLSQEIHLSSSLLHCHFMPYLTEQIFYQCTVVLAQCPNDLHTKQLFFRSCDTRTKENAHFVIDITVIQAHILYKSKPCDVRRGVVASMAWI